HTPPARAAVLRTLVRQLGQMGVELRAARLQYNLFTLRATVDQVEAAATATPDDPFLAAERVTVDVPWRSVLRGSLALQSLEVFSPRVTVHRQDDGLLNLPPLQPEDDATGSNTAADPFSIGRLVVRDFDARYIDEPGVVDVEVAGFTLELEPQSALEALVAGRFAASDGVSIRVGEQTTKIVRLDGRLAFDGATLLLDDTVLEAPEGELLLEGRVGLFTAQPAIDLTFSGELSLDEVARWMAVDSTPTGRLTFDGRASGPPDDPQVALRLAGDNLAWLDMDVSLRASGVGNASGTAIETLTVQVAGGSVDADAAVQFDEHGAVRSGEANIAWRDVDTARLLSAVAGDTPIRVTSKAEGTLTATLSGSGAETLTARAVLTSRAGTATSAFPLSGHAELDVSGGAWTLAHDHRLGSIRFAGSNGGRFDAHDLMGSTLGGGVTIATDDLSRAAQDLSRAGIELPARSSDTLAGRMTASAALRGTFGAPSVDVALDATALTLGPAGPGVLTARATLTPDRGQLTSVALEIGPNRAQGFAVVGWENGALDGHVTVDAPDLALLTSGLPTEWRPAGSLRIEGTLAGTAGEPRLTGTLDSSAIAVAGQHVDRVTSTFGLTGSVVVIEDLTLAQTEGRFSGRGRYDLSAGRYSVQADAEEWEVRPIPGAPPNRTVVGPAGSDEDEAEGGIPVAGRFDLRLEGDGTIAEPAGKADVTFTGVRYGDYLVGSGRLDVEVVDGSAAISASLADLLTGIRGTLDLQSPHSFSGTLRVDRAELSRLAGGIPGAQAEPRTLAGALEGALALSADVTGQLDQIEETNVDLQVELIDAAIDGTAITLVRPARFQYRRQDFVADAVDVRFGETRVTLAGRLGQAAPGSELRAIVDGSVGELLDLARLVAPDAVVSGDGSIAAHVAATGSLTAPVVTAGITAAAATLIYADLPPVTHHAVDATNSGGLQRQAQAGARWQGASISATAEVPAAIFADYLPASYADTLPPITTPARLGARIESITRDVLTPFADEATLANIDAQVSGRLDLEATALNAAAVEGRFELDRAELTLARVPLGQLEPTRLTLADGRLRVDAFRWGGDGNQLVLTGDLALGRDYPDLNLDLDGVLDLRMVSAFLPDVATDGTAHVQLAARGTTAEPDVNGQVALENVDLTIREPRVAIADLAGTIQMTGDRLSAAGISGSANGGTLIIGGELTYPGLELGDGTITLAGRRLAMALQNGVQAELDADLALSMSAADAPLDDLLLTGRITVLRGAYREPISLADLALGDSAAEVETAGLDEETFVDRIRLDVALVTAEDLRVDNNYGHAEIGANVTALGTVGQPGLSGRATIREGGQVFLGGNTYIIEQSTIDFTDPTRIEPELNLRARTRIGGYGITLGVSGTLDALENDLQADPPLSESDIVSILVTGRTLSEAGNAQTEVARDQVLGYLSGDLLGFAGRAVGLDAVRFERGLSQDTLPTDLALFAGDEDPSSRLTISKNVRRDVEIVLSQNLRQSGGLTWIAMYRPLPPIELRTISRDDDTRAYEFRHTLQFGGGVRSRGARAAGESLPAPRVTAVRFAGDLGFGEDSLRSHMDLDAGDRFDFFVWQRDRDRLESFYHARDYREARIGAGRESTTGAGGQEALILTYTIERGPHTTLRTEGHALPRRLLDDIRESWGRSVFDGFL
ncbi:MAG: translocation/assembly module TamB domain-containing protein, partial [Vicinamibacterales bacterium]